jgi:hypothetical protein
MQKEEKNRIHRLGDFQYKPILRQLTAHAR